MKAPKALIPVFFAFAFSTACIHTKTEERPLTLAEASIVDSDLDSHRLEIPRGDKGGNLLPKRKRKKAKEAGPQIENISILFETKTTTIPPSSDALLVNVADQLRSDVSLKVRLDAYSVEKGKEKEAEKKKIASETLSNVKERLVKLGVDPKRIRVSSYKKDRVDSDRKVDVTFE